MRLAEISGLLRKAADELDRIADGASGGGGSAAEPPLYWQRDPLWARDRLGFGNTTIGAYGCVITSLAMALSFKLGQRILPTDVNMMLKSARGFTGENGNLIIWDALERAFPGVRFRGLARYRYRPAPRDTILSALEKGHIVVAQVDLHPGGPLNEHWVWVLSPNKMDPDMDDYWIHDPWKPAKGSLVGLYGEPAGWKTAARAIFSVVVYEVVDG